MKQNLETLNVWINGLSGRMGQVLEEAIKLDERFCFVSGASLEDFDIKVVDLEKADVVIDFSSKEGSHDLARYVKGSNLSSQTYLICSTGLADATKDLWKNIAGDSQHRVMLAPNTSLGILLSLKAALGISLIAKKENFDIAIEETHHRYKKDSPSGTALFLGQEIARDNGLDITTETSSSRDNSNVLTIGATRGGGIFGEHRIRFIGDHEEVSITHRAFSRELFARGALYLAHWLSSQAAGYHSIRKLI